MHNSFHYAFKVKDIASTKRFYVDILGCKEGRFAETWYDFDFFGHQLSAHISESNSELDYCGQVDGISVASTIETNNSITELNAAERVLVKVINVLGQEVNLDDEQFNGTVLFNVYNDGSVDKFVK